MIRKLSAGDLDAVMAVWLEANLSAHDFISREYWTGHYEAVREALPRAEVLVSAEDSTGEIDGFIGLDDGFIAGLFVREDRRSRGIGKRLLDFVKAEKNALSLKVYQKNHDAVRFYKREGFAVLSEEIDPDTGEEELTMVWRGGDD